MVLGLKFKSLIHFKLIFVSGVRKESSFISLQCGISIFPTQFIEKTIISPLCILGVL